MLNVLHFSLKPAYPKIDGGCVAIAEVLNALCTSDEISLYHFTLSTHKHPFNKENYPSEIQPFISESKINTKLNPFKALISFVGNKSYNVSRFESHQTKETLETLLQKQWFDIAILESIYLLPYLSVFKKYKLKVIVRTHNVESQIWHSLAKENPTIYKRKYLNILSKQLKKYELAELRKVDGIMAISEEDATYFRKNIPSVPAIMLPVSVPVIEDKVDYSLNDFYFLGAMDWRPNIDGIHWLLKEVIPNGLPKNTLYIAGKNLQKDQFQHPSVKVLGEVEDKNKFIQQHGICIIPLLSGSGIKIKLLENMAAGKPIITTSEGARGTNVKDGKEVMIADSPQDFSLAIERLEKEIYLRQYLGENARKFILTHYNSNQIAKQLIEFIGRA